MRFDKKDGGNEASLPEVIQDPSEMSWITIYEHTAFPITFEAWLTSNTLLNHS